MRNISLIFEAGNTRDFVGHNPGLAREQARPQVAIQLTGIRLAPTGNQRSGERALAGAYFDSAFG